MNDRKEQTGDICKTFFYSLKVDIFGHDWKRKENEINKIEFLFSKVKKWGEAEIDENKIELLNFMLKIIAQKESEPFKHIQILNSRIIPTKPKKMCILELRVWKR